MDILDMIADDDNISKDFKKVLKEKKIKEKRCSYRVVICIHDLPNQSVEDMELNAQEYIKDDIEMDNLYIEDIIKIEEWEEE